MDENENELVIKLKNEILILKHDIQFLEDTIFNLQNEISYLKNLCLDTDKYFT